MPPRTLPSIHDADANLVTREGAIHLCPSGVHNSAARLEQSLAPNLSKIVRGSLGSVPSMESFEILALTGPRTPTVTLHGSRSRMHNTGRAGSDYANKPIRDSAITNTIADLSSKWLPGWTGIEKGTLNLDPVGLSAVPTSRLIPTENSVSTSQSPIRAVLETLLRCSKPYLCQILARKSGQTYPVTIRVADLMSTLRLLSRHQTAKAVSEPPTCLLDKQFSNATSSRRLAGDYWETKSDYDDVPSTKDSVLSRPYSQRSGDTTPEQANLVRDLLDGTYEYTALMQGIPATDLYQPLGVEPELSLSAADLEAVVDVFPLYGNVTWNPQISRNPAQFDRTTVISDATGTESTDVLSEMSTQTAGISPTDSLVSFIPSWFAEAGHQIEAVSDPDIGEPTFRSPSLDSAEQILAVDPSGSVVDAPATTAGEIVATANQAVENDQQLLVVTPDRDTASWVRSVLLAPFDILAETETGLYDLPAETRTSDGGIVLTDRERPRAQWWLTPGNEHVLRQGDRVLASGPADAAPSSYSYDAFRAVKRGTDAAVLDPDGAERARYDSIVDCTTDYRVVRRLVSPSQHTFTDTVTIVYRDGCELLRPTLEPAWADRLKAQSRVRRKEAALTQFLETYTLPSGLWGPEAHGLYHWFMRWYRSQADYQSASRRSFLLEAPDRFHVKADNHHRPIAVENRRWRIPDVSSPDNVNLTDR